MNCLTQKEAQEVLDQLQNNPLYYTFPTDYGFRENILELYGVQYIGKNGNGYEYEAVIFNEYNHSTSEVMFILNTLTGDVISYEEAPIKQISDTCVHFILSQYYDPSIYDFLISDLWL